MNQLQKTLKGFVVSRRCDTCGVRITLSGDDGDRCILKCSKCGKEYSFYYAPARCGSC